MTRTDADKITRTPALVNACPTCGAAVARWCKRPSGHRATFLHADRVKLTRPEPSSPIDRFGDKRPERLDPKDETVVVTLRIPARYVRELDRLAADVETTRSGWARDALLEAIDPHHHLRVYATFDEGAA